MVGDNVKRIRLLKIWEILTQDSDEDHPLTTDQIKEKLAKNGIECDRRTLYNDIEVLNSFGYEVFVKRSRNNLYYVEDRSFSVPEVLIIMDAIQAASFITENKTAELVDKVGKLSGSQRGEVLKQNIVQFSTVKSLNDGIYYSVSEISSAIVNQKKIEFNYFMYDAQMNRNYKMDKTNPNNRRMYKVNPIATVFANDNYYLFCYDDKYGNVVSYRIDRMDRVKMTNEDITPSKEAEDFDLAKHKRQMFFMYSGEEQTVEIEADKSLIDVVHDKFGKKIYIQNKLDNKISFTANVEVSPMFISWVCAFGNKMRVVGPREVVDQVKKHLQETLEQY